MKRYNFKIFEKDYAVLTLLLILSIVTRYFFLFLEDYGWDETIYAFLVLTLDKYGIFFYSLKNPLVASSLPTDVTSNIAFTLPLFVHPPLFSYLLFIIARIFGEVNLESIISATFIINALSIFLISALVYKTVNFMLNDKKLGFYLSLIVITEPVLWLSSLKIWMDTFVGALSALFIVLYLQTLRKKETGYMILTGIFGGLLLETKLSTIFLILCILIHSSYKLKEDKKFILIPIFTILLALPWAIWNYLIYGFDIPIAHLKYTMFYKPPIYQKASHYLAYIVYLPIISPMALLGYLGVLRVKENEDYALLKIILIIVTVFFSIFSATRELRYITPIIFIHLLLAAGYLSGKRNSLVNSIVFFILIYNFAIVFLILFLENFSYAPDIITHPFLMF